ncbi:MAG: alpha/beta fold hydrolase [Candidatus Spechtbacterales bacterium]|nr:alpha/beta fold hydrolase [Candidatus Spechtbacterales bacterium]
MEKKQLVTQDNITIVGDYYSSGAESSPAVILLHMMPATRESWRDFAPLLVDKGFQVLAIDERGHGESIEGGKLNYEEFSSKEQQDKMLDVLAAREYFLDKGVEFSDIYVGGASIGANLAIQYLAHNHEAKAGFALSPGYNYHGIETLSLMEEVHSEQALFLAASHDDPNVPDSAQATQDIADADNADIEIKLFDTGGHGTDMFEKHPELMEDLAEWLTNFK